MVEQATLCLQGIRKSYGVGSIAEAEVLHGIDLTINKGEFTALIGPSGSGKSTLLNLIGLLDRPTAGRLIIAGVEAASLDDAALTRLRASTVGFVFQHHNLLQAFTAQENVMLPLLAARGHADAGMQKRASELIAAVGLTAWSDHLTNELSGGRQQRVAIARALVMQPALVLADEPTGNLDTESANSVFRLMRQVNRDSATSFLIVTHDPRLARRCDRIIELVDGRIFSDRANQAQEEDMDGQIAMSDPARGKPTREQ
ncbi:MAG: ABC transporter ATP-binding protein [Aquimonas sp.]|nr:ABC transporter ATP-binding protein [Aquimonas sp.]